MLNFRLMLLKYNFNYNFNLEILETMKCMDIVYKYFMFEGRVILSFK